MGENSIKKYINLNSLKEMKFQIEMQFWAKLNGEKSTSVWIWSLPGVGKSSTIQDLGEELTEKLKAKGDNRRCITRVIQANHLGEGEIGGMAAKTTDDHGEDIIKKLMVKGLLPNKNDEEYNLPGIIFFDELGDAKPEVRPELLSFCDGVERKDGYTMPPNWVVVAAGNTEEGGGLTFGEYAANVKARFVNFFLVPNADEWLRYAGSVKNKVTGELGLHPYVLSFIRENKDCLYDEKMSGMEEMDTAPSPRKWHEISSTIKTYDATGYLEDDFGRNQLYKYINAQLTPEIGQKRFITFIENINKIIPPNELIGKNSKDAKNAELKEKINKVSTSILFLSFDMAIRKFVNKYGEASEK